MADSKLSWAHPQIHLRSLCRQTPDRLTLMASLGWHPVQPALAMHYWSSTTWPLCPRVFSPQALYASQEAPTPGALLGMMLGLCSVGA